MCAAPDCLEWVGTPTRLDQLSSLEINLHGCGKTQARHVSDALRLAHHHHGQPRLAFGELPVPEARAESGLGIGILPFYQVESDFDAGRLVGPMPEYRLSIFGRKVMLLAMPDRYRTAASGPLIEFVKIRVRADMAAFGERFNAARLAPRSAAVTERPPPADARSCAGSAR